MIKIQSPDKYRIMVKATLVLSLTVSILITAWILNDGFLLTPDSYHYLSAAKSFHESGVFKNAAGINYTHWPPLFPIIIAMFSQSQQVMVFVFLFCKIVIGLLVYFLANRFLENSFLKVIYIVAVLLSVHVLLISVFLWSELIFMMLLLIHVYATLMLGHGRRYWYLLLLSGVLLCLQRNAGVFWIFATALWLLSTTDIPVQKRLLKSMVYLVVCSAGLVCWYAYNIFFLNDSTTFIRRDFFADSASNIQLIASDLGTTFFPANGASLLIGALIAGYLSVYWFTYFRADRSLRLLVVGLAIYTAGFIPIPGLTGDAMERFFAVVLPLIFVFPFRVIEHLMVRYPTRMVWFLIVLLLWLTYPAVRMGKNALFWNDRTHEAVYDK